MKKRLISTVIVSALVLAQLAGCGQQTPVTPDPAQAPAQDAATAGSGTAQGADSGESASKSAAEEGDFLPEISMLLKRIETEDTCTPEAENAAHVEPFPYGYVVYPEFTPSEETVKQYPEMSATLKTMSDEYAEHALTVLAEEQNVVEEWKSYSEDGTVTMFTSNEQNWEPEITRADDRIVCLLMSEESYYNGAHPYSAYRSQAIDTKSGERLPLSDVINDMFSLPYILLKNLKSIDETYEFSSEEEAEMLPTIEEVVADGALPWSLDDEGFHAYFNPYVLQAYAFGPIFVDLPYSEWPDLIRSEYMPTTLKGKPITERVTCDREEESAAKKYSAAELKKYELADETDTGSAQESAPVFQVECPDYFAETFAAEGVRDPIGESLVTLTELEKYRETREWLDVDAWSERNNVTLPSAGYATTGFSDGAYHYEPDNRADEGVLRLTVSDANWKNTIGVYDFSAYLDTPGEGRYPVGLEIPCASLYAGTLYVQIAHRTYSESQPYTGFIVAVEPSTGKLLWRSDMLKANASNFMVIDDQIICGYGFTDEDDYIYILSRHNGGVLKRIKVKSAPEYFIRRMEAGSEILYVLTYNTAYKYEISYG